jgi:hypothetical protein
MRPTPTHPGRRVDRSTRPPTINHGAAVVLLEMIREARRKEAVADRPDDAA